MGVEIFQPDVQKEVTGFNSAETAGDVAKARELYAFRQKAPLFELGGRDH
jgi:hypothetical protein